ncbi:MAG: 50S ribosomal protein L11 methyltransferase [Opitutus sp.]
MQPNPELAEMKAEISVADVDHVDEVLLLLEDDRWSLLEDAIARRAWIIGIFDSPNAAWEAWTQLTLLLGASVTGFPETRALGKGDWQDSYKAHFHAWQFGRLHWVPVWQRETFSLPDGDAVLWLDPGMAFGTGNHETTRLCVERLVEHAHRVGAMGRVFDAGCGSGILALSAATLGFTGVIGFDKDPEAVRVSQENASLNQLTEVCFFVGDLQSGLTRNSGDVVLANILANVLVQFAEQLADSVAPHGILVLSGILAHECEAVRTHFASIRPSWQIESRTLGEWSDVLLRRHE